MSQTNPPPLAFNRESPLYHCTLAVPFLLYNVQLPIKEKKEAVEQWFLSQFCDMAQVLIIHKYV
jgi:hypothetical protein